MAQWLHYTCEHRLPRIAAEGALIPHAQPMLARLPLTWFTLSTVGDRTALGLTSATLHCDRMAHLFRVIPDDEHLVHTWAALKREPWFEPYLPGARRLEAARGTRPALWGVATERVRVTLVN